MEQLIEHDTTQELSEERISETPLHKDIAALLEQLREISPHNKPTGWIFASTSSLMVDHIQPAAVRAGVDKRVSWKMLGHANSQITTDVFAQPVPSEVRSAHDKLVDMVIPAKMPATSDFALIRLRWPKILEGQAVSH